MSKKNAFCLITVKPNKIWVEFLDTMTKDYDVFIVLDDSTNIDHIKNAYKNIVFIQFNDEECKGAGYWDSSFMVKKNPSGWDKALYYFFKHNMNYDQYWFCEDDVFFYNVNTIKNIDFFHKNGDLLCNEIEVNNEGYKSNWHWQQAVPYFPLPWAKGMVCCCRLSRRLLDRIAEFVQKHNKLTFIECLFPTLALGWDIETPNEFSTINWRCDWSNYQLNSKLFHHPFKNVNDHVPSLLYHPFKNVDDHFRIRQTGKLFVESIPRYAGGSIWNRTMMKK